MVMLLNRTPWHMPVTEIAKLGSTEIWSLVNLTDDTHPIHLHHVRFQVIDRRGFDRDLYLLQNATLRFTGSALAPNPNEADGRMWCNARPTWSRGSTFLSTAIPAAISGIATSRNMRPTT
jgi:FtsP/CotA-like multicopper oxidase with cupredoxin domain